MRGAVNIRSVSVLPLTSAKEAQQLSQTSRMMGKLLLEALRSAKLPPWPPHKRGQMADLLVTPRLPAP